MKTCCNSNLRQRCWRMTLAGLLTAAGMAAAPGAPRLSLGTVRGFPGATVNLPLTLRYGSNDAHNVVALQADIGFDGNALTPGLVAGGSALQGHELATSLPAGGTYRLLVYSLQNTAMTNGTVATVPFTIMPGTFQNLHLTLDNVVLATAAAQPVLSSNGPGAIVINQVYLRPDGTADGFLTVSTNTASRCYVVQATTDLQSWINVSTNEASDDLLLFLDTGAAGHPYRFYRAVFCDATGVPAAALATLRQLPQGGMEIQFQSGSGRSYHLQSSTNLLDWVELTTLTGTGLPLSYLDHRSTSTPQRFYRIRVE